MLESATRRAMAATSRRWRDGRAWLLRRKLRVNRSLRVSGELLSIYWRICLVVYISSYSNWLSMFWTFWIIIYIKVTPYYSL
jgi:hypothetical protein